MSPTRVSLTARLVPLFLQERALFAKTFPRVAGATLWGREEPCFGSTRACPGRSYAQADLATGRITILERAVWLPEENLLGLLDHELGHLADPTPFAPGAEQRADDLAEVATGRKIRYDPRDVQTLATGRWPRPEFLHR